MEINFDFLQNSSTFKEQYSAANKIYKLYTIDDYRDVISNARLLLETLTKKIFQLENLNPYYPVPEGEYRNLRNDTHYLRSEINYPLSIMDLFDEVRRMGNAAIHDAKIDPDKKQAWRCICDVHDILVFLVNSYDGQDLYYLRPDISMEAQTDEQHYYVRKNRTKPLHLRDHKSSKKKIHEHTNKNLKKAKHFSSHEANAEVNDSTKENVSMKKESLFAKIKNFWHKK